MGSIYCAMNIITKFTVASDEGINTLTTLTKDLAKEKLSSILDQKMLEAYINKHFNTKQLVAELNDLSNQWLVVYADNHPAGYAKITSYGKKPQSLENKRAIRIADFAVLKKYSAIEIKKTLFEKCLSVCKHLEGVWINEYLSSPFIEFFESNGFARQLETCRQDDLELPSICLVRLNDVAK